MGAALLCLDGPSADFSMRLERGKGRGTRRREPAAVLHLSGELDIAWSERVGNTIVGLARRAGPGGGQRPGVVVDVSALSFIDATGVAALAAAEEHGQTLVIRGAAGIVRRVLEVSGLSPLLEVELGPVA